MGRNSVEELILVGRSDDNTQLVLLDDNGQEFRVDIDDSLVRCISTRPTTPTGHDSSFGISPRDIQTRVRRGEALEDIANESGVAIEKIERFAGPVLAERNHMANRACGAFIKRGNRELVLDDAVIQQLESNSVDTTSLAWDAWRREDGRWTVSATWVSGNGSGLATWVYDPINQSIVAIDDQARWLLEEKKADANVSQIRPVLVSLPDVEDESESADLEAPSWAGPGHPTIPVSLSDSSQDDSPSWDDILFGHRPNDN